MNTNLVTFTKAIADETRQELCHLLCCLWLSVNDIVDPLVKRGRTVKQPTGSHHLKFLEEAKLVKVRKEGRQRFYTLNQEQMTTCCGTLITTFAPDFAQQVINPDAITMMDDT